MAVDASLPIETAVSIHESNLEIQNFKFLAAALAIGLLIGLERGWNMRDKADGMRVAGFRTYPLLSLLGALWGLLAQQGGVELIGFAYLGLTLILLVAYRGNLKTFDNHSITSTIAAMVTFSLGTLIVYGHAILAAATAVIMTSLLGFKPILHRWVSHLDQEEIYATLKLLLISVVVLPVLPDQNYGPWDAFNPYHIWWMVVLIAGISYLGYFATKIVGNRHGSMLTGLFGGLVSSTAVTLNLSRLVKHHPGMQNALAAGIIMACATMLARILLVVSILNPVLFQMMWQVLLAMAVFMYLMAFLFWRQAAHFQSDSEVALENPFQIGMALKFGALLLIVMLLTKALRFYFGDMGAYILAAISGVADVDAITLSMANISQKPAELNVAVYAILIAVFVNTVFKSTLSWLIGDKGLMLRVGGTSALTILLGTFLMLFTS
jgi:uncharacterized membrane protein (DUF4010 family)